MTDDTTPGPGPPAGAANAAPAGPATEPAIAGDRSGGRIDAGFAALARVMVRHRWLVVVAWLSAVVVVPTALPSLASQIKPQNADFLPKGTPSLHAADLATPFQARNVLSALLVGGRSGQALSAPDDRAFLSAEATLTRDPAVLDVRDQGLSRDRQARKALVEFRKTLRFDQAEAPLERLRAAIASVGAPAGLRLHLAGEFAQAVDKRTQDRNSRSLTQQLSLLFILVLLVVVFRAPLAAIVTVAPALVAVLVAGPVIGEAARAGLSVSSLTQILLTVIVLGAGTDYGLFLIYRVREELARGLAPREAVTFALSRVGETITFSALCVIFALVSVVLADFGLYRGLGPGLAIGVAVVLVAGLTLLPALLTISGRAAFWPTRPRPGQEHRGVWGRIANRVVGRPRRTLALGLTVFVALALALIAYQPAGFGARTAPSGSDSALGQQVLVAHFPVAVRNPTNVVFRLPQPVWTDPAPLVESERALRAAPQLSAVLGGLEPNGARLPAARLQALHAAIGPPQRLPLIEPAALARRIPAADYGTYRAVGQFVAADGRTIQFYGVLRAGDPSSTPAVQAVPALRRTVDRVALRIGAVDHGVAGEAPAAYDVSRISTRDLRRIVPVVLLIIGVLLAILLRSLVAPLYLIASVGLSYLAALGLAIVVFIGLAGEAGLNFVLPFFMFVFLMALGSDYNILVMTRIREEARGLPLAEAVRRAVAATGGTVTSAGLVLAGTFAVLTATGDSQTREIGLGLAAGILLDTFLVRTLLIPAAVLLVGRWNWWPSRLAREAPR